MMHHLQPACRACGAVGLTPILPAAAKPAADRLLGAERPYQRRFKHTVGLALCPTCTLVQMVEVRAAIQRLQDPSADVSHASAERDRRLAAEVIERCRLTSRSLVVQIASGDGHLLKYYKDADVPVLGIEVEATSAVMAQRRGVPTLCQRFGLELAQRLAQCGQPANVIHVRGVLTQVADLQHFVQSLGALLAKDGLCLVEEPSVRDQVDREHADSQTARYLSHFSLTALVALFKTEAMQVCDVRYGGERGKTLHAWVRRSGTQSPAVQQMLEDEDRWGVDRLGTYQNWANRLERIRTAVAPLNPVSFSPPVSPILGTAV